MTPAASSAVKVIAGNSPVASVSRRVNHGDGWDFETGGGMDQTVEVASSRAGRFQQWAQEQATGGIRIFADPIGPEGTGVAAFHVTVMRKGAYVGDANTLQEYRDVLKAVDSFT